MSLSATNVGTTSTVDIGIALVKGEMAGSRRNLVGRRHECEELDEVVARARVGNSPVLVLRGEAGPARHRCSSTRSGRRRISESSAR